MANSSVNIDNYVFACPHLGQDEDPCTYSSYASSRNFCYHSKPRTIPLLDHQSNFCLSENYPKCPVYQLDENAVFPDEFRFRRFEFPKIIPWKWLIPLFAIIITLIIIFSFPGLRNLKFLTPEQDNTTIFAGNQILNTTTPNPLLGTTPSMVEKPTITQAPSASPVLETGTPSNDPHGLDEPIGVTHRFVIHRIQEGESLGNLAAQYDTSLQAIQDVNYFLPDPVWIDWLVIIPVETTDVIGLPKFEAQIVVTGGVTIEEFAADQDLDPSTLKFYNGLPDAYLLSSGEWLLIPHINQ